MASPAYDCIIVGGGISGFYSALNIQKKHPSWSIAILEKYKGVGGRTYTYHNPEKGVQWEMGAGRISKSHKILLNLIKKYDLNLIPLHSQSSYIDKNELIENDFSSLNVPLFIEPLHFLPQEILQKNTLFDLLKGIYGFEKAKDIVVKFPYWAEVYSLRADLALKAFLEGEMKNNAGYSVLKEGFSELIARMRAEFEEAGGEVLVRMSLEGVSLGENDTTDLVVAFDTNKIMLKAVKVCLLALHVDALRQIRGVNHLPVLKMVKTAPLMRIYAVFPKTWFQDMKNTITNGRLRYIIPISYEKGIIMISYTDGDDVKSYARLLDKSEEALESAVMSDIRRLFPDLDIPDPTFFKAHHWETGCSYWQPGDYNVEAESRKVCRPLKSIPRLFICGESFSLRQAWVEGALEHADECLRILSNV